MPPPPPRLTFAVADGTTGGFSVDDGLWCTEVELGTPAATAGVESGMRLVAFQGKDLPLWGLKVRSSREPPAAASASCRGLRPAGNDRLYSLTFLAR